MHLYYYVPASGFQSFIHTSYCLIMYCIYLGGYSILISELSNEVRYSRNSKESKQIDDKSSQKVLDIELHAGYSTHDEHMLDTCRYVLELYRRAIAPTVKTAQKKETEAQVTRVQVNKDESRTITCSGTNMFIYGGKTVQCRSGSEQIAIKDKGILNLSKLLYNLIALNNFSR